MKNSKKIKSLVSLFLCLCLLCSAVISLSSCEKKKFDYELNEDGSGYTITGYRGDKATVKIPEKYKSKPVIAIGKEAFAKNTTMQKVVIPEGVKEIGFKAFYNCTSLVAAELPEGLTKISSGAFEKCTALKEVKVPEGVTTVIDGAFMDCTSLRKVSIPSTLSRISGLAFIGCSNISTISVSENNKSYKTVNGHLVSTDGAFVLPRAMYDVKIEEGIREIGAGAFNDKSIRSVVLPKSVEVIGQLAFANCNMLNSIFYLGSEVDYGAIEIADLNTSLDKATVYYYSETEPTGDGNFWHYVGSQPTVWQK